MTKTFGNQRFELQLVSHKLSNNGCHGGLVSTQNALFSMNCIQGVPVHSGIFVEINLCF